MGSIPLESSGASANLRAISRNSYTNSATLNEVARRLSSTTPVTILTVLENVAFEDNIIQRGTIRRLHVGWWMRMLETGRRRKWGGRGCGLFYFIGLMTPPALTRSEVQQVGDRGQCNV